MEPWLKSLVYRVETDEGTFVLTGDAGPCQALDEACRGADVLVMCCAYHGSIAPEVADVVTGASDAARIGASSGARAMVLTHTTSGMAGAGRREATVAEVARQYDGKLIFADELTSLDLP